MHLDKDGENFVFDSGDDLLLGLYGTKSWPIKDALGLLQKAEMARMAILDKDESAYPAGASRTEIRIAKVAIEGLVRDISEQITPFVPSVAKGASEFLRTST